MPNYGQSPYSRTAHFEAVNKFSCRARPPFASMSSAPASRQASRHGRLRRAFRSYWKNWSFIACYTVLANNSSRFKDVFARALPARQKQPAFARQKETTITRMAIMRADTRQRDLRASGLHFTYRPIPTPRRLHAHSVSAASPGLAPAASSVIDAEPTLGALAEATGRDDARHARAFALPTKMQDDVAIAAMGFYFTPAFLAADILLVAK